jgi:hypothetical protein
MYEHINDLNVLPSPTWAENSNCSPGDAEVLLTSGVTMRIDELAVGDSVHVGHGRFSPVFMVARTPRLRHSPAVHCN